jgi:glucose/arabinose dehydrogenase
VSLPPIRAGGSRIMSLNPDGSNLKAIVNKGLRIPDGVAVDADAGHIYWTNMGNPNRGKGYE